jgi:phage repressor protein C with HTH and peptisase S24 domain
MNTLRERLIWARAQKSERDGAEFTQEELAKRAGVSQGSIGHIESGRTQSSRKVTELAYALGVDVSWLTTGKGVPFPEPGPRELPYTAYKQVDAHHEDNPNVVLIPKVRLVVRAGISGFQVDEESGSDTHPIDLAFLKANNFPQENLIAIKVVGHSMEPRLYEDDIVIINTADTKPVDGEVYVINYDGEAVIKRMSRDAGSWWLMSDNPDQIKYHRKSVHGNECVIVGRVIKKESTRI